MARPRAAGEDDDETRVHVRASQPPPSSGLAPAKAKPPHWVADDDETLVALERLVPPAPMRTPLPAPSPFLASPPGPASVAPRHASAPPASPAQGTPRIVYTWVATCAAVTVVGLAVLVYIQR